MHPSYRSWTHLEQPVLIPFKTQALSQGSKSRVVDEPHLFPGFCAQRAFPGEAALVTPRGTARTSDLFSFSITNFLCEGQANQGRACPPPLGVSTSGARWRPPPWSPWLPPLEFLLERVGGSSVCPMGLRHAHCAALVWASASLFRGPF